MLRVKIPVGDTQIEVEASTESELESIFRVAMRTLSFSPNAATTAQLTSHNSLYLNAPEKASLAQSTQQTSHQKLHYPKNASNAECLEIALDNIGHEATAGQIYDRLKVTGGVFQTRSKTPKEIVRATLRNDDRFFGTGTGWILRKWQQQDVSEAQRVSTIETQGEQIDGSSDPPEGETY